MLRFESRETSSKNLHFPHHAILLLSKEKHRFQARGGSDFLRLQSRIVGEIKYIKYLGEDEAFELGFEKQVDMWKEDEVEVGEILPKYIPLHHPFFILHLSYCFLIDLSG